LDKFDRLNKLLNDPTIEILFEVLESRAFKSEADAANHLVKGTTGHTTTAEILAKHSQECRAFVNLLRQFRVAKAFEIHKAVPEKINDK
jgi:hypothetical protein